jgi:MerR family copper efflux transcriptional regulator
MSPDLSLPLHQPTLGSINSTSTLCKAANVTRGQLRLYEDKGLITPQGRTAAGYRQYGAETLNRLKAIMYLKDLGFTLAEIAMLLSDRDNGELDDKAIQKLAKGVVSNIDRRIAGLQVIRGYVAPVAVGDMGVLEDEDCSFVIEFLSGLSAEM